MVKLENGKYIVLRPEDGLMQDINPDRRGLPFESEQEAKDWEAQWVASCEAAKADAKKAIARAAETTPEKPQLIDPDAISDAEFRRIVLERLGVPLVAKKEV